ncbi:hypothetical protein PT974_10759 [Cladobotryum mycophilum]|uniref:Uncharacterized protein n=1 Tax=Cladobotryum mycophilum TaxID=491253 RepID=A0ABR0SAU2_9HYPO
MLRCLDALVSCMAWLEGRIARLALHLLETEKGGIMLAWTLFFAALWFCMLTDIFDDFVSWGERVAGEAGELASPARANKFRDDLNLLFRINLIIGIVIVMVAYPQLSDGRFRVLDGMIKGLAIGGIFLITILGVISGCLGLLMVFTAYINKLRLGFGMHSVVLSMATLYMLLATVMLLTSFGPFRTRWLAWSRNERR